MKEVAKIVKRNLNESEDSNNILKLITNGKKLPANIYNSIAVWKPRDKKQLRTVIDAAIEIYGNEANLNWIDVSEIADMSGIF
jgi:hypothetical protein